MATADDPYLAMLRGAAIPTIAVGAICAVVAFAQGTSALVGALLGVVVVIAFFSLSLVVMRATANARPDLVLGVVMLTYITKVGALAIVLVLFRNATWLSATAFALTALACTLTWLAFEVRAFMRMRVFVVEPADSAADPAHEVLPDRREGVRE